MSCVLEILKSFLLEFFFSIRVPWNLKILVVPLLSLKDVSKCNEQKHQSTKETFIYLIDFWRWERKGTRKPWHLFIFILIQVRNSGSFDISNGSDTQKWDYSPKASSGKVHLLRRLTMAELLNFFIINQKIQWRIELFFIVLSCNGYYLCCWS